MTDLTKKEIDEELGRCAWDPLRFALFAFPWGEVPEFSLVKLPPKWRKRYPNCEYGPDEWTCRMFDEIARQVRANRFDGTHAVKPIRIAVSSGHGIGKAERVDTVIDTPDGPRRFGDLCVGDRVFGADGKSSTIIDIPFEGKRPCYRVTFDDGSSAVVAQEHLWNVRGRQERRRGLTTWRTLETQEILSLGVKRKNGQAMARQWEIPRQEPVEYPAREFSIDPYLLGLLIGNGSMSIGVPTLDISSPEVFRYLEEFFCYDETPVVYGEKSVRISVKGIIPELRRLGLYGSRSEDKFIPDEYKYASYEQRAELFRGLFDSDGEVGKKGTVGYSTTSMRLRDDVVWLARSLGGKAQVQPATKKAWYYDENRNRIPCKDCYRVTLTMPRGFVCGRYKERVARVKPTIEDRYLTRWIDSIEPVGELDCMCISVDRPDGLYLTNDFIVTHNSFATGLLCWWLMATRPNCKGTITATTMPQLQAKTWAQIAALKKWCIVGDRFEITTGKGSMKFYAKEAPDAWACSGQTSKEENSESFAGQHAASSTSFYVVDECSGVPEKILEVCEGGLTDGEPMIFCFGNPTRSSGAFYNMFHADKDRWTTFKVDSREAQLTNKEQIAEWEKQWGADSDFFKVRVRGEFPDNASLQFVPTSTVDNAMTREAPGIHGNNLKRAIIGLDIARFGDDTTVLVTRVGRDARSIPWKEFRKLDGRQVGLAVEQHVLHLLDNLRFKEVFIFFDRAGIGASVWDYFRYEFNDPRVRFYPIDFGMKARDGRLFANKRIEMWGALRDWLKDGVIPRSEELKTELIAPEFYFNDRQQMVLERKSDLKDRLGCSPDHADALALTFAEPNADRVPADAPAAGSSIWAARRNSYRDMRERDPFLGLEDSRW